MNLCGTMHDIREAWNRHVKLFPQSLRKKMMSKHPASDSCAISLVRDKKEKYGQEQVPQFPPSNGVHPHEVFRKPLPSSLKEKVQLMSTKEVLSNGGETRDSEPAFRTSRHSGEDGHDGSMVVGVEISDHAKENALTAHDLDQSRPDEPGPMDVTAELGIQPTECASNASKSAHDLGKSTGTAELVEASHSTSPNLQSELDLVSLDNNSFKSQEKGTQELIPMYYDEHVAMRNVSSRASHLVESLKVGSEPERDGSVSQKHNAPMEVINPEEPSRIHEASNEIDNVVPAPGHATSRFQDQEVKLQQSPYGNHHPTNAVNSKRVMNQGSSQQSPARQQRSHSEDKTTILDQQRQEPASYPEQNTNPTTSQQEWQAQQMNQMMLQYQYQQYQYQQQHQLQMQMQQNPYYHYMNQQQPYQQQNPQQHMQIQQGHEPNPNSEKPQEVAYQVHQYAYQQQVATPEQQQLLWQQYQQYQGYQLQQQQQQYHQQAHIQQNFTPHIAQSQQVRPEFSLLGLLV